MYLSLQNYGTVAMVKTSIYDVDAKCAAMVKTSIYDVDAKCAAMVKTSIYDVDAKCAADTSLLASQDNSL